MKKGWEIKTLGEVCEIYNGNSINEKVKKDKYTNVVVQSYPFIATKDVLNNKNIVYDNGVSIPISEKGFKIAFPGSTLICVEGGSAGKKIGFLSNSVCFGNKLFALKPFQTTFGKYLFYYVQSELFFVAFKKELTGIIGGVSKNRFIQLPIPIPPLAEQKRIVSLLDRDFAKIDTIRENAEKNLQNLRGLWQAALKKEMEGKDRWTFTNLEDVAFKIFAGGDAPKQYSKVKTKEYYVPIFANAVTDEGLYGYTDNAKVFEKSITIAARGSIGFVCKREEPFVPIVRLIVVIPNSKIVLNDYLYYALKCLNIDSTGSSIPQLTVPMIKQYKIAFPSLSEQEEIVESLDETAKLSNELESNYNAIIKNCQSLKQAFLCKAFTGAL